MYNKNSQDLIQQGQSNWDENTLKKYLLKKHLINYLDNLKFSLSQQYFCVLCKKLTHCFFGSNSVDSKISSAIGNKSVAVKLQERVIYRTA